MGNFSGLFGRRKTPPPSVAPAPDRPYAVVVSPQWKAFAPAATPNQQVGAYAQPYGVPSQVAAYWPDIQLKCGVEGMRPWWYVDTRSDVPYFQQTVQLQDPKRNLLDGGRPGPQLGPAQVSALWGPSRQQSAAQLAAIAKGLAGW